MPCSQKKMGKEERWDGLKNNWQKENPKDKQLGYIEKAGATKSPPFILLR